MSLISPHQHVETLERLLDEHEKLLGTILDAVPHRIKEFRNRRGPGVLFRLIQDTSDALTNLFLRAPEGAISPILQIKIRKTRDALEKVITTLRKTVFAQAEASVLTEIEGIHKRTIDMVREALGNILETIWLIGARGAGEAGELDGLEPEPRGLDPFIAARANTRLLGGTYGDLHGAGAVTEERREPVGFIPEWETSLTTPFPETNVDLLFTANLPNLATNLDGSIDYFERHKRATARSYKSRFEKTETPKPISIFSIAKPKDRPNGKGGEVSTNSHYKIKQANLETHGQYADCQLVRVPPKSPKYTEVVGEIELNDEEEWVLEVSTGANGKPRYAILLREVLERVAKII